MLPDADAAPGMALVRETTRLHLSVIEADLAQHPYFAGAAFTAADVMMAFPFTTQAGNPARAAEAMIQVAESASPATWCSAHSASMR